MTAVQVEIIKNAGGVFNSTQNESGINYPSQIVRKETPQRESQKCVECNASLTSHNLYLTDRISNIAEPKSVKIRLKLQHSDLHSQVADLQKEIKELKLKISKIDDKLSGASPCSPKRNQSSFQPMSVNKVRRLIISSRDLLFSFETKPKKAAQKITISQPKTLGVRFAEPDQGDCKEEDLSKHTVEVTLMETLRSKELEYEQRVNKVLKAIQAKHE